MEFDELKAYAANFNRQMNLAFEIQEVYNGLWMLTDGYGRVLATIRTYGPNFCLDVWRQNFLGQEWWQRVIC